MRNRNISIYKSIRGNIFSVLLSAIAVSLVFWNTANRCDMRSAAVCTSNGKNLYETNRGGRLERILRSENTNIFQELSDLYDQPPNNVMDGMINVSGLGTPLNIQIIQEQQQIYEEQLDELIDKITDTWNDTFISMVEDYIDFTERNNIIDGEWKCQMWNQRWYRYLQYVVGSLNEVIQNDNYPLETKEYISDEFLNLAHHDFICFLSVVKEQWDNRVQSIGTQEVRA
ncbi:Plasmodium exported protein, unknown function [Plasmodium gonderi]|uniref:Uncharacterized protein n=1 Tax=Plasmodium gonderi TaxID=77519 RepID=A0A1Y1JA77_PLAGO|nr:Plasmodium exported protein, unknown function [Plasmodium gonderi]GAW79396.1 Plasmodium exported protein, unknown function [Plasmodium gonderi]